MFTHGPEVELFVSMDVLSISDLHRELFMRAKKVSGLAISWPLPLYAAEYNLGVIIALPFRDQTFQSGAKDDNILGYMVATINFDKTMDMVFERLRQSTIGGSSDYITMRLDDVTHRDLPVPLYEPPGIEVSTKGPMLPPGMNKYQHSSLIWKASNRADLGKPHWSTHALKLGDDSRQYEIRCKYEHDIQIPWAAVLLGLGTTLIYVLLQQIVWEALRRFQQMKRDYTRMSVMKHAAEEGIGAKSAFLGTMTHEILTPINGLMGMINLLLKTSLDVQQLDYVRTAEASGTTLIYFINDALDLANLESGHFKLESISFNIRALVDEVLGILSSQVQDKGNLEVAAFIHDSVPSSLIGDPVRLRQILLHIVGNAIKFTSEGHVFITVRVKPDRKQTSSLTRTLSNTSLGSFSSSTPPSPSSPYQESFATGRLLSAPWEEDEYGTLSGKETADLSNTWLALRKAMEGDRLQVESHANVHSKDRSVGEEPIQLLFQVEDTGVGIPEGEQDHIFKPFVRLQRDPRVVYAGTGIGLSLSERLIHLMNGSIDFVSRLGIGTTFKFDVHLEKSGPEMQAQTEQRFYAWEIPSQLDLRGKKVMVVDGRNLRQQVLAAYLRRLGLEVELCDNVFSAVMALRRSMFQNASYGHSENVNSEHEKWDVVLLDADTGGSGSPLEFGRLLLSGSEQAPEVWKQVTLPKLVLLACSLTEEQRKEAMEAHFSATLLKPIRAAPLSLCLQQIFHSEPASQQHGHPNIAYRQVGELLKNKTILVADDNFVNRKVAGATVLRMGAKEVLYATSGRETVRRLRRPHNIDCAILALRLPDIDGIEATRQIRAMEREANNVQMDMVKQTPIIALTTNSSPEARLDSEQAGINAFLVKPLNEMSLISAFFSVF